MLMNVLIFQNYAHSHPIIILTEIELFLTLCHHIRLIPNYVELGNITILSFIMILKCHDNQYRREFFSIVISGSTILL